MAPVGQVLGRELFSKTKMCKFHRAGKCAKGEQCPWAHDPSELQAAPDLRCTKLCKELIATGQCTNPDCNFAHNKEEWRTAACATDAVTHSASTDHVPAKKISVSKALDVGKTSTMETSTMDVPKSVPSSLRSDAPGFIPMNFNAEAPALVPMRLPLGLQGCAPYSLGYPSLHRQETESDGSSTHDIKLDGDTPISQILALSLAPKQKSSPPMFSPPPGLERCTPYSPTLGYTGFHRAESVSDSSSNDGMKQMDGNTPISEILAMSTSLDKRSSNRQHLKTDFASFSTAGSLADLLLSPEETPLLY